jgi:hypothetical protein
MKFKGTLVFAAFAIALGLYVYLIEFKKAAKDEEAKAESEKVLNFEAAKVKGFILKNSKGEVEIERADPTNWKITKPLVDLADSGTVNSMLSDLGSEKYDQVVDGDDLKSYGLDHPQSTITINLTGGAPKTVSVGADAALPGKAYLLRADDKKILYVNTSFKTQLDRGLKDLRDKRIFRKNKDDVQQLTLKFNAKDNKGSIGLTKKDSRWLIDGKDESADDDAVNGIIKGIDNLRANNFVSENATNKEEMKKHGLNTPTLDITLEGKEKTPIGHLLFSAPKDNSVFITSDGSPTIYQVFSSSVDSLMKKPQDFRNKKLPLQFKREDVGEILVKNSLSEVHLIKKGELWTLPLSDSTKEVSQVQVANFLEKLSGLKVAEYLESEKPQGLSSPTGHAVLRDSKGDIILDLTWGERAKNKRNYYAKSNKYKGNFTIEATSLEGLPVQTLVESKATPTPSPAVSATPNSMASPPSRPSP